MYYLPIQSSDIAFRLKCFLSFQSLTPAKSFGKPTEDTHQLLLSNTDPAPSHSATLIERHVDPKLMMSDKKMSKRQSSAKQDKESKFAYGYEPYSRYVFRVLSLPIFVTQIE